LHNETLESNEFEIAKLLGKIINVFVIIKVLITVIYLYRWLEKITKRDVPKSNNLITTAITTRDPTSIFNFSLGRRITHTGSCPRPFAFPHSSKIRAR